ncbi:GH25 family lysozyme [Pseudarthrobacter sp. NamE5]|uniref:GH25 family lysozyme n=1 Tax=Pseudarthrobacter sp. NamE5 TaxID=2576839 RepID=UPI0014862C4E|nr:GH25 family lysozyme [Pseudarthrobacter sp. NamE5]
MEASATAPATPAPESPEANPNPARWGVMPLSSADAAALAVEMGQGGAYMGAGLRAVSSDAEDASVADRRTISAEAYNTWKPPGIQGVDVSSWQPGIDWDGQFNQGARFAYVKATEGTTYTNPEYHNQYNGSRSAGMIRGAYHFATPSTSSGADQARYFVSRGGGWSADGITLPPLLDIEYNPYQALGNTCYNMSATQMVTWIRDFSNTMVALTGRKPAIYTTTDWWKTCTANNGGFSDHPLHLASYATSPGTLPNGWSAYSIWQYSPEGPYVGDSNVWNGTYSQLKAFAYGRPLSAGEHAVSTLAEAMPLGAPLYSTVCGIRDNGCYQGFRNGEILWSPATGAHTSRAGAIRSLYRQMGAENSLLGYPTSGEQCGLRDGGCYQMFQGGAILWSFKTGAQLSRHGAIREAWAAGNFENGALGYPTGNEICGLRDNGCYQSYQHGQIHWSPKTGAHPTRNGAIRSTWAAGGYESGVLGYPTGSESCGLKDGGCSQAFQNGQVHWSNATGAYATRGGAIRSLWLALKSENGVLGYPLSSEICGLKDSGCYQSFQHGQIHWSAGTGAQPTRNGAIRNEWAGSGYENGVLGFPTGPETCGLRDNGCYQSFQGGQIHWSPATGAQPTKGAISAHWAQSGWENGPLGYPTGRETCSAGNECTQTFQRGTLTWTPTTGVTRR